MVEQLVVEPTNFRVFAEGSRRPSESKPIGRHNVSTHFPKDPNREVCNFAETARGPCRNRPEARIHHPQKLGDVRRSIHISLRWFLQTRRSLTTSNLTPPDSRVIRCGRSAVCFGREVTLCNAQGVTLYRKKAELQTLLKLIATLWK